MFYLLNFTLYPNTRFHESFLNCSQPTTAPFAPDASVNRSFICCGETLAKRDLFTASQIQFLTLVLYFFSSPLSLMLCSSPPLLLAYFSAIVLATGQVIVTLNQLYGCFISLAHSVFPLPAHSYFSAFLGNVSVLLCNQIIFAFSSQFISQVSPGIQDGNHLIHHSW